MQFEPRVDELLHFLIALISSALEKKTILSVSMMRFLLGDKDLSFYLKQHCRKDKELAINCSTHCKNIY